MPKRASKPPARAAERAKKTKPAAASHERGGGAPAPAPEPATSPAARGAERTDARWRAAEERLLLRIAVLEDVVRRGSADHARRISELEKRHAGAGA